jgi:hypothetical protein
MYFGESWERLLYYYDRANADPRQAALRLLEDYYNNPPGSETEKKKVRESFGLWLDRRDQNAQLVQDLRKRLSLRQP